MTTTKTTPFNELSEEETTDLAKRCLIGAKSEDEVRENLTKADFDGDAAAITSTSHTSHGMTMFMAMVMVHGPNGEIISV